MAQELTGPGEIIEVCQDCGHVIDPEVVTAPWGDRYQIRLCMRDECIADRIMRTSGPLWPSDFAWVQHRWWYPPVTDPKASIRIVGF